VTTDRLFAGTAGLPPSPQLRRIALTIVTAAIALATASVASSVTGSSASVTAAAVAALLTAAAGVTVVAVRRQPAGGVDVAALIVTGLAGAVLSGLVPGPAGFLLVSISLGGLAMILELVPACAAGLLVLAAATAVVLISGQAHLGNIAGPDIGAAFTFAVGAFTRSARISQNAARAAQAQAENLLAQLRASQLAQAEAAKLTERARVAREIHDILAHALSGLVLALDTTELLARQGSSDAADPEVSNTAASNTEVMSRMLEQVSRAQRIARDGLADTRRAVAALRGDELPGPALLDRLVTETAAVTGIRAVLTVTGDQRPLPPEIGLALYRTAQETLTNTAKYAGREGRAELRLRYTDREVELDVEDARSADAVPPAGLTFGGYGLTGIRERAELLGGRLTAGPTATGFKVLLSLPATPVPAPQALT
jgi:signal transduction histidine kinase